MLSYLSPGVYVEEVPSAIQPIAGVGTSTAGFIGVGAVDEGRVTNQEIGAGTGTRKNFNLPHYPVNTASDTFQIYLNGDPVSAALENDDANRSARVRFEDAPPSGAAIAGDYQIVVSSAAQESGGATGADRIKLCVNFAEFKKYFGDFSQDEGPNHLAHAVYGFFNNGGTRCYVARVDAETAVGSALEAFEAIDEIAIVAAPGILGEAAQTAVIDHCEKVGDRFAILDGRRATGFTPAAIRGGVRDSNHAALYFPWLEAYDPATQANAILPPSGHIAGLYARIDAERGVHKAPANTIIRGVLGLEARLSKAHHDGLNPQGINVIRDFNGSITVWGARTLGGDANGEWKYINVRRLFLFLRESINNGTRWVVFEPNDPALWAKITRNITAFLTNVWRAGALFGATPQEAFYVKCDAETNPPEVRDAGQVVTEIGVAAVKPAEFAVFRISQQAAQG